jgi:phosphoribosylformylglycinamidine cyclo-ligase
MSEKADYRSSGVDIHEGERAVALMRSEVRSTFNDSVLSDLGQFGGLFRASFPGISNPVLVASTDGVGTKLKVAAMAGNYTTVGQDLVNHCINDILVQGASPLFFMDYVACGELSASVVAEIVSGLAAACRDSGCALLGGETAEMPGFYSRGDYDVAGTIVGVVEESSVLDGSSILAGDVIVGLPSSGLHTNGYSLARRVLFQMAGMKLNDTSPLIGSMDLGNALLQVHRCYLKPVATLLEHHLVKGLAHITGGGIPGNLSRILPQGLGALIDGEWEVPGIFRLIQELGEVDRIEMLRAFNMGAGMLAVMGEEHLQEALEILESGGEEPFIAGRVVKGASVDFGGYWF